MKDLNSPPIRTGTSQDEDRVAVLERKVADLEKIVAQAQKVCHISEEDSDEDSKDD